MFIIMIINICIQHSLNIKDPQNTHRYPFVMKTDLTRNTYQFVLKVQNLDTG